MRGWVRLSRKECAQVFRFGGLELASSFWNPLEAVVAATLEGPGWGRGAGVGCGERVCRASSWPLEMPGFPQAQSGEWKLMVPITGSPGSRDRGGIRCGRAERGLCTRERALRKALESV